jgi:hypothetical protein
MKTRNKILQELKEIKQNFHLVKDITSLGIPRFEVCNVRLGGQKEQDYIVTLMNKKYQVNMDAKCLLESLIKVDDYRNRLKGMIAEHENTE